MDTLKIRVIIGSTRQMRFSEKPAQWIFELLAKKEGVGAELLDLRDYSMPFFEEAATPSYKTAPYTNPVVAEWTKKIAEADAFIIVTPEYNHGYPAVLKNALDYVYQEWNNKAVGFVGYGSVSGARSIEQLRQVVVELQMVPIRSAIHVPPDMFRAYWTGDGAKNPDFFKPLEPFAETFLTQLLWWARMLKGARGK